MSELLDDLARSLATPMPRRRALRVLGGALVSTAVPAAFTRAASASPTATQACEGCGVPHGAGCVLNKKCGSQVPGHSVCCKWPGHFGPFKQTGAGGHCAQAGGTGLTPPGGLACCCPDGTSCGSPGTGVCQCRKPCGKNKECCGPDEECLRWKLGSGGTNTYETCRKKCPSGSRHCSLGGGVSDVDCCPNGQNCCAGECCDPTQVCVRALGGNGDYARLCVRTCKAPEVRCNFVCCNADQRAYRKLRNGRVRCLCVRDQ